MSAFSIGGADDEDDFADLRRSKPAAVPQKAATSTLGAVPPKKPEPVKGEIDALSKYKGTRPDVSQRELQVTPRCHVGKYSDTMCLVRDTVVVLRMYSVHGIGALMFS